MLLDLHAHSTSTADCFFDAHDVIQAIKKAGLDGLAFTDTAFHDDADDLRKFGTEHGVAVLFGREVYTSGGHLLVFTPDYEALRSCPWDGASEPPEPEGVIEHVKKGTLEKAFLAANVEQDMRSDLTHYAAMTSVPLIITEIPRDELGTLWLSGIAAGWVYDLTGNYGRTLVLLVASAAVAAVLSTLAIRSHRT